MTNDRDDLLPVTGPAPAARGGGMVGAMDLNTDDVVAGAMKAGGDAIRSGDLDTALEIFTKLTVTAPKNPEIHNALGVALASKGDVDGAERSFRQASKLAPDNGIFLKNHGAMLFNQKRFGRALKALRKSLELLPGDIETQYQIALLYGNQQRAGDYERALFRVVEADPSHFEANNDLGCHLITRHRYEEAVERLRVACRSPKAEGSTYVNLGNAYVLMGRKEMARETYAKAVELNPDDPNCLSSLAVAERNLGDLDAALQHIGQALAVAGDNAAHLNTRGTVRRELGALDLALEDFERALTIDPDFAPAQVNRGLLRLLMDDWANGFEDLEARWRDPNYASLPKKAEGKLWDGSELDGGSMLLFGEQGRGDAIQFIRFAPMLAERGTSVVVRAHGDLKRLFASSFPSLQVVDNDQPVPRHDHHAPMMSLPRLLRIAAPEAVSAAPYLTAPPADDRQAEFLGADAEFRVGINWAGARPHREDYKRSVDPALFDAFGALDGVRFVDLQFDAEEARPDILNGAPRLADVATDFADSAAIVGALDLVISVDTATVHLAGALGVPCWALIPAVPDWRWRREGELSPWYESVRLFRQTERGDWQGVIERVATALSDFRDSKS